jgi:hypothetical protein
MAAILRAVRAFAVVNDFAAIVMPLPLHSDGTAEKPGQFARGISQELTLILFLRCRCREIMASSDRGCGYLQP